MKVGKNIRYYRKKARLTQKQLAKMSNLAEITIRKYEAGQRNIPINNINAVADALGITVSDLISGLDTKGKEKSVNIDKIQAETMSNSDLLKLRNVAQNELDRRWYELCNKN